MILLSIIIVNWNTSEFLVKCLDSILRHPTKVELEIIVVDNDSDEDIISVTTMFPDVRLIKNAYNYGFGVATNVGFSLTSGKYAMTLNPDTVLESGMIDALIETLETDDQIGVCVPVLKGAKVYRSQYFFSSLFFNSLVARKLRGLTRRRETEMSGSFDVDFITGTGYICRVSALARGRMFVEDNFLFGEEYFLCREIAAKGLKISVVPQAKLQHYTSVTFRDDSDRLINASRLGSALGWSIRRDHWGKLLGFVSGSIIFFENIVKWALLQSSAALGKELNLKESRMLTQCESLITSFIPLITGKEEYIARANTTAEIFFNNGKKPTYPPVFTEVGRTVT
ncbi:MAG: glycosyltransferase family 2 protein [Chloracidobacterium sp.]|nr:glycosyltransferase family 2 protein [Chloracidobacterium sp.]